MDQSILVGLIAGTASVPQDDLTLDSKTAIILFVHDMMKKEMENLVTKGFQPFREFVTSRKGRKIQYNCAFPITLYDTRVGLVFTTDTSMIQGQEKGIAEFVRHSALITAKGDLFWLTEECVNAFSDNPFQSVWDVVKDVELVPLDRAHMQYYLRLLPEMFLKLLTNFRAIAEQAFEMRKARQERTQVVLDKLTRINNAIGLVKFV